MTDMTEMKIVHVNATKSGGGVAEMLQSLIPALNDRGITTEWFVPDFPDDFFVITKKFHNALQGLEQNITLAEIARYLKVCGSIELPDADLYIMHDPQVLPIAIPDGKAAVWRCHIETTGADAVLVDILAKYINGYDRAVWTSTDYVPGAVTVPVTEIDPCIDLANPKNKQHTGEYARKHLDLPRNVPIIGAVSRFDPHKGQEGIIKAFKAMDHPTAHLVILGNFASDDPEGETIFNYLKQMYASERIHIIGMNDIHAVGSLMALSDVYVQFSSKEGFGLVVAEAMNQGTLTIGSNVGGIPKQIINDETGYLVESGDIEALTEKMRHALDNPEEAARIAENGRERIHDHFTLDQLINDHIALYESVV